MAPSLTGKPGRMPCRAHASLEAVLLRPTTPGNGRLTSHYMSGSACGRLMAASEPTGLIARGAWERICYRWPQRALGTQGFGPVRSPPGRYETGVFRWESEDHVSNNGVIRLGHNGDRTNAGTLPPFEAGLKQTLTGTFHRIIGVQIGWSVSSSRTESTRMYEPRPTQLWILGCLLLSACGLTQPPVKPDPELLRCYRITTDLPASYGDTLGYEIPRVIRLTHSSYDQWIVLPTDQEWHPSWSVYDGLPSSYVRLASSLRSASISQRDSIRRIPGDSIDISFPSAIGTLVFRLGRNGENLRGRAEWVVHPHISFKNEGKHVAASPTSCEDLPQALARTRYR